MLRYFLFTLLFLPLLSLARSPLDNGQAKQFAQKRSLSFIENKGQVTDQSGRSRSDIDFKLSAGKGLNIFIGKAQLHYQWCNNSKVKIQNSKGAVVAPGLPTLDSSLPTEMYRMDVELLHANPNAEVIREEQQDYYETYYTPPFDVNKGATVRSYNKITYKNIYPNIDWVFYSKDNQLKYDFIVHPGGNVKDIQLKYGGATDIKQNADGSITASSPMGIITEQKPYSFEKESGSTIASKFVLQNGVVSFNVVEYYDRDLVIDPTLEWATYFGGSGQDDGTAVTCDQLGNVYIVGVTNSANNIASVGAYQTTFGGTSDAFVAKFNRNGTRIWSTYYGGSGDDLGLSVCFDGNAYLYIAGWTSSHTNVATTGAFQSFVTGGTSAFVAKFNTLGVIQWATYFGWGSTARSVTCDGFGNVYFAGELWNGSTTTNPNANGNTVTPGAYQTTYGGGSWDAYLAKFSGAGNRVWATFFGGSGSDEGRSVMCDIAGNVFLSGITTSLNNIATSGAYQSTFGGGGSDCFIAKFDSSCNRLWATYFGGAGDENLYSTHGVNNSMTEDGAGNIYITGYTSSTTNIASAGAYQTAFGGGSYDAFLAKFSSSGNRQWSTYFGGAGDDFGMGLAYDGFGNIFMTGFTTSTTNIATVGAYQGTYGGNTDAFIAKFSTSDSLIWATYFGGSGSDFDYGGIVCDGLAHEYIIGTTNSTSNIATPGAYQINYGGGSEDAFIAKFTDDTLVFCTQPFADTQLCSGIVFPLLYTTVDTFKPGNVFIAQLSNGSGSFTIPVSIGSVAGRTSGTISCTIPSNTPAGAGYRIRIIASSPIDTSIDEGINIRIIATVPAVTHSLCVGDSVRLHAVDTFSGITYSWAGPNSFTSASKNVTILNSSSADSGKYVLTESFSTCSVHDTFNIDVNTYPGTPASSYILCSGDTLKILSGTPNTSYTWTGPNNFSSTASNIIKPNAGFSDSGYYHLSASHNGCSITDTIHVTVNPKPAYPLVSSNSAVCEGANLMLSSTCTTAGVSYSWTGPNSFTSSLQNPVRSNVIMADSGSYFAMAVLGPCSSVSAVHVVIILLPPHSSITSNSPLCTGDTLKLNASNMNSSVTYSWSGPNTFSSVIYNPIIANAASINAGNYVLTTTLNNCSVYDTLNATVKPLPANLSFTSNSPLCANTMLNLSVSSTSGSTFSWAGPGGFTSAVYNPSITNIQSTNAGYYKATANLNGCTRMDSTQVSVKPLPASTSVNCNNPVCQNDSLHLYASSSSPGINYSWSGPAGFTSTLQNPSIGNAQFSNAGNYNIVFSLNGCTDTLSLPVAVNPALTAPTVSISVSPGDTVCAGTNLTFTALAGNAGSPVYTWRRNGVVIPATNTPSFTTANLSNGDHITCTINSNFICQAIDTAISNSIHLDLISNPPPVVSISVYPPTYTLGTLVTFTGHVPTASTGLTYAWTKNGVFIAGHTTAIYTDNNISPSDVICFIAYSNVPCTIPDSAVACGGALNVKNVGNVKNVKVYPNPMQNELVIESDGDMASVSISNVLGQSVYHSILDKSKTVISTREFVNGVYFVQVTYSDGSKDVVRVVKE